MKRALCRAVKAVSQKQRGEGRAFSRQSQTDQAHSKLPAKVDVSVCACVRACTCACVCAWRRMWKSIQSVSLEAFSDCDVPLGVMLCLCVYLDRGCKPLSGSQGLCDPTKLGSPGFVCLLVLSDLQGVTFPESPSTLASRASTLTGPVSTRKARPSLCPELRLSIIIL